MTALILYKLKPLDCDKSFGVSKNTTYIFLYIEITGVFKINFRNRTSLAVSYLRIYSQRGFET